MKIKPAKLEVMSIVHGKSELLMCRSLKSNLKIKHEIHARNKGKSSIQVNSIINELESKKFNMGLKKFSQEFGIEYNKKKLINFKLFIIMDLDDCEEKQAKEFRDKSMFIGHPLYDYIEPIYNDPNLEGTMKEIGVNINPKEKIRGYFRIFPTNKGDLDIDMAIDFLEKLKKCQKSNLYLYFDYCIAIAQNNSIK